MDIDQGRLISRRVRYVILAHTPNKLGQKLWQKPPISVECNLLEESLFFETNKKIIGISRTTLYSS